MIRPKIWKKFEFKEGKGFSFRELKSAGISLSDAKRFDLAVDASRRSRYDDNVVVLADVKAKAPPRPAKKAVVKKALEKKPVEKKKAKKKEPAKKPVKTKPAAKKKAPEKKPAKVEKKEAKKTPAKKKPAPAKKTAPKKPRLKRKPLQRKRRPDPGWSRSKKPLETL